MSFRPQDTRMFRPYPDEVPWELLRLADPSEERILDYADADLMRVAKYEDEAVGVYVVRPETPTRYEICNLAVAPAYRHKGLGRWLLGHAIGLAETKGAREIVVRRTPLRGLFRKTGFVEDDGGVRLELQPE